MLCEVEPMTVIRKWIESTGYRSDNYVTLRDRSGTRYRVRLSADDFSVYFPIHEDVAAQFFHGKIVMIADGAEIASTLDHPAEILRDLFLWLFVTGLCTCCVLCVLYSLLMARRTPMTTSEKVKAWAALYKIQPPR
jgi:hypothetical protein